MSKIPNIRLGVSACLLGKEVRYDGGHRRCDFVCDVLADEFDLVAVCPEEELGMGVPRETVQLETVQLETVQLETVQLETADHPSPTLMMSTETRRDWTAEMNRWCRKRCDELAAENLSGFVFKKNSPSCGVFNVPLFRPDGSSRNDGRGLFAAEIRRRFPDLPVIDEERLEDAVRREEFLAGVRRHHQALFE